MVLFVSSHATNKVRPQAKAVEPSSSKCPRLTFQIYILAIKDNSYQKSQASLVLVFNSKSVTPQTILFHEVNASKYKINIFLF